MRIVEPHTGISDPELFDRLLSAKSNQGIMVCNAQHITSRLLIYKYINLFFIRKSHSGNHESACDRISKEALRELIIKEEPNMPLAISTNIAAEKANYYLGYNADKMQESIKRLASGKKLTSPVQDPGNLAVSMKLSASLNRLAGAMNNAPERNLIPGGTGRDAGNRRQDP